jgi:hypothetical protein
MPNPTLAQLKVDLEFLLEEIENAKLYCDTVTGQEDYNRLAIALKEKEKEIEHYQYLQQASIQVD